jgi:uncharacterized membrane protein
MERLKLLLLILIIAITGYALHKLIRAFINPGASVNHKFLYFIAHFIGIFVLSFLVNLFLLKTASFWFAV